MKIFKFLFNKNNLDKKINQIKNEIEQIVKSICIEKFWIDIYGAYDIDPKHLVFWICVQTDSMKARLNNDENIKNKLYALLEKYDYPISARKDVFIGVESQENVDRESGGNWHYHFK